MKDFDDYDILLIRQCKKNKPSLRAMRRIVGMRCALSFAYVTKADVIHFLLKIVMDYNLIRSWDEFLIEKLNPKKWWSNTEPLPYIDNLYQELVSKIACSEVKVFPRYRSPLYFRIRYDLP